MKKVELQEALSNNYYAFISYINSLTQQEFEFSPPAKWSAGQQLDHLIRSTLPLADGLSLPKFFIKVFFGKANRASKSYNGLVEKYHAKLSSGGKASGRFIPKLVFIDDRVGKSNRLISVIK
ncbi:MAG TPA: hypothetical protein VK498_01895 [Ferruginibacter sp.]|nr:hypothetical protein [Ferruginibacter sp.]